MSGEHGGFAAPAAPAAAVVPAPATPAAVLRRELLLLEIPLGGLGRRLLENHAVPSLDPVQHLAVHLVLAKELIEPLGRVLVHPQAIRPRPAPERVGLDRVRGEPLPDAPLALVETLALVQGLRALSLLDAVQHVLHRVGKQRQLLGSRVNRRGGERGGHGIRGRVVGHGRGLPSDEHPAPVGGGDGHGDAVDGRGVQGRGFAARGAGENLFVRRGDEGEGLGWGLGSARVGRVLVVVREERVGGGAVGSGPLGLGRARVGEPVQIVVVGARLGLRGALGPRGGLVERAAVLIGGVLLLLHRVHHVHLVVVGAHVHVGVILDERVEVVKIAVVHRDDWSLRRTR